MVGIVTGHRMKVVSFKALFQRNRIHSHRMVNDSISNILAAILLEMQAKHYGMQTQAINRRSKSIVLAQQQITKRVGYFYLGR